MKPTNAYLSEYAVHSLMFSHRHWQVDAFNIMLNCEFCIPDKERIPLAMYRTVLAKASDYDKWRYYKQFTTPHWKEQINPSMYATSFPSGPWRERTPELQQHESRW